MLTTKKNWILVAALMAIGLLATAQVDDPRQKEYNRKVWPILKQHCFSCHNAEDNKGGLNFDNYFFINSVIRHGERFQKAVAEVQNMSMPPDIRPPIAQTEIDTFSYYINKLLQGALAEKDPGIIAPRRLNNQEYKYVIQDLLHLEVDVDSLFPADPSGGAGFDNHAKVLYLTPLHVERYFETADGLLDTLYQDSEAWRAMVPAYTSHFGVWLRNFWNKTLFNKDVSLERPRKFASTVLFPFATLAYRRFLEPEQKTGLLQVFEEAYLLYQDREDRYDLAIRETMKRILISPHFLYRQEGDPPVEGPYKVGNFELASRLSFFLWSSMPDEQLLNAAYREDLHQPEVLQREVRRMLKSSKARRLGEQFAIQWLELKKLTDPTFQIDQDLYPAYTPDLRNLMLEEVRLFFNNVVLESKNFLELLDSDYSYLNEDLARHYGIQGVEGSNMRKVNFTSNNRGGVLGMAGVLTATSLPTRTSPVLRGKWVLEQILGTPAPPPPADVPDLEASHDPAKSIETLRTLLERHRANPACQSCHEAMDPIGLGLENFDAIGRWRMAYGEEVIDPSGVLKTGEVFKGPAELRKILLAKQELFAKNFSRKMLAFALGRSLTFKDTPTIEHLQKTLLNTNFNSERFIVELTKSYPFRFKKSDNKDVPKTPKVS